MKEHTNWIFTPKMKLMILDEIGIVYLLPLLIYFLMKVSCYIAKSLFSLSCMSQRSNVCSYIYRLLLVTEVLLHLLKTSRFTSDFKQLYYQNRNEEWATP